jgi:AraC-like DNA-binding protein
VNDDDATEDALREVLRSVRLEASLMSRIVLTSPFAVRTRALPRAIFHAVAAGRCRLTLEDSRSTTIELGPGDVALLAHGQAHEIHDDHGVKPADVAQLPVSDDRSAVALLEHGGGGPATRIVCGYFTLQHAASQTMLQAMPAVVRATGPADRGVGPWIDQTIELLAEALDRNAPGSDEIVTRLTDVLVIHVLRDCVRQAPEQGGGWLSALRDERIGRALATMHRRPGGNWTVSNLATRAGMSRSSFFARFSELVGEPPARYLARWRVSVAADLMARESLSVGQLAERVGYASEDAFARVFKRFMGVTPVQFRRSART